MKIPLLFLVTSSFLPSLFAQEMVAHRGASYDAPENTLASMRLGWEQGAEAGELDVWLSADQEVVLLHDATTKRTGGRDRKVSEQTLAELRELDVGSWKDPKWAGETIATLSEAIAAMPVGRKLLIEIKCGPEILPSLKKALAQTKHEPGHLVIIGFGYETMRQAKEALPAHPVLWIVSHGKDDDQDKSIDTLIQKAKDAGLDGLDLSSGFPVDKEFVKKVKAAGLLLYTWTIDDPAMAKKWKEAGVDGITTNRPGWLREQLR